MKTLSFKKILCIGAGYVGGPTMAVIARKCPDCQVTVVDVNPERIAAWNSDTLPIYEPGLDEAVRAARGRNLFFSTDIAAGIRANDLIFVSVNTPTKTFGAGAGMAADLQYWEKTAREILEYAEGPKIVIEKSTLPVKTALAMERILSSRGRAGVHFEVLSNPEFLAEGTAIRDLEAPDRVLIGSRETPEGLAARALLVDLYARWVPRDRILTSNIWSSELSKLVSNAFLAQRISSINAISALCEKTEASVAEVARAVGMDSRIGPKFLNASVGFGGSCFKKDILNLVYLCRAHGLDQVAAYWEGVVAINEYQKERFVLNMMNAMFNSLAGKRIAIFGFAFKADTGDTRESPAIYVAERLLAEHAEVVITDPQALPSARIWARELAARCGNGAVPDGTGGSGPGGNAGAGGIGAAPSIGLGPRSSPGLFDAGCPPRIDFVEDPVAAAAGCHAIALMTEWPLYRTLDYERIFASMVQPAFIFDGRNLLDHERLHAIGFNVYPLGRPPLTHWPQK